tara:strand:+ start:1191 stop:2495 length:1305 start_codon:yes stop_codon:yes gene_type:complete
MIQPMEFSMRIRAIVFGLLFLATSTVSADNWPNWRGPTLNGVAPKGTYPVKWSATKNVAWKIKLSGKGTSTPIIWNGQIILTSQEAGKNITLAVDRSGKTVWKTTSGGPGVKGKHRKASGSNPSPVTDGKGIYVYFKNGDLVCLTLAGKAVWQTNLQTAWGKDTLWWDIGTSPVLSADKVLVAVMQTGGSYVAAFNKSDGKVAWKHDRNLEAPLEAAQSYTTPIVLKRGGVERLLVLGADHVTAHEVASGKELWRVGGLNPGGQKYFRSISSPVIAGNLLLAPYSRGNTLTAIRLGGNGDVTKSHVAWMNKGGAAADVPSPIVQGDRAFVCSDRGRLTCLDVKTGKAIWSGQAEKNRQGFSSSPILAGGRIYITREDGKTFVVDSGDSFKVVAANELGEFTVATPIFSQGQILLRTTEHLYCIGKRAAAAAAGE